MSNADETVQPLFGEKDEAKQTKKAMFSFSANEGKRAGPLAIRAALREEVRKAFRDDELFNTLEDYLLPPGLAGTSAQFNHAFVISILLDWDARKNKRRIASFGFTPQELWYLGVDKVLRKVYEMRRGYITGLLEHKPDNGNGGSDAK